MCRGNAGQQSRGNQKKGRSRVTANHFNGGFVEGTQYPLWCRIAIPLAPCYIKMLKMSQAGLKCIEVGFSFGNCPRVGSPKHVLSLKNEMISEYSPSSVHVQ